MKISLRPINFAIAFCLMFAVTFLCANLAHAATSQIEATLCIIVIALTGGIGKAIATIAVVVLGIGLFMGKLSWPVAAATALGIGLIFGAATVVNWVQGTTGSATCGTVAS